MLVSLYCFYKVPHVNFVYDPRCHNMTSSAEMVSYGTKNRAASSPNPARERTSALAYEANSAGTFVLLRERSLQFLSHYRDSFTSETSSSFFPHFW